MKTSLNFTLSRVEGCLLVALGICFLNVNTLLVGGTAGLAALLSYQFTLSFGLLFTLINLPFFVLAYFQIGKRLALNSLICILMVSGLTDLFHHTIHISDLEPLLASILAGLLIGLGLAILFKANASLGGINILAIFLERRKGVHSAMTMVVNDIALAVLASLIMPLESIVYSAISFGIMAFILKRYHMKPKQPDVEVNRATAYSAGPETV